MAVTFLSDEWFQEVERLQQEASPIDVPEQLANLDLNLDVAADQGNVEMCMTGGKFQKGFHEGAPIKMALSSDLAMKIFIEFDQSAAMQAFMAGQLTVEGDMSQLMALQTVQPSADQKQLLNNILELTA